MAKSTRRYKRLRLPHHPLAGKSGEVRRSRVVLWEVLGGADAPCHWCRMPVLWFTPNRKIQLFADHVNGDTFDDSPKNLVPSCPGCNTNRSDGTGLGRRGFTEGEIGQLPTIHGTEQGVHRGCQCEACATARAARVDASWAAWRGRPWDDATDKHGERRGYKRGCRCDLCRAAEREYDTARRRARGEQPRPEAQHGKGLAKKGCQCDICRDSRSAQGQRARARRLAEGPGPGAQHGTEAMWVGYGCRCEPCRAARAAATRRRKAARSQ